MGKTTNILDLNNRLERVEKENVAQNSYTSLKNKPKINGVTLTGNKSLVDIGAAAASDLATLAGDVGDKTELTTTVKTDLVSAINELNGGKSNGLITEWFSLTGVTVLGGSVSDYDFDVIKSGYTPLSVAGYYIGGGGVTSIASAFIRNETNARIRIVNPSSSSITPNDINIGILYVKN